MIKQISEYILLQNLVLNEIKKACSDIWDFTDGEFLEWKCHSHGEHICCINNETGAQIELPLLSSTNTGIDVGHFMYYLKTTGIETPSYQDVHNTMQNLENENLLEEVQSNNPPIIWNLKR